jgi:hypothetical protein
MKFFCWAKHNWKLESYNVSKVKALDLANGEVNARRELRFRSPLPGPLRPCLLSHCRLFARGEQREGNGCTYGQIRYVHFAPPPE